MLTTLPLTVMGDPSFGDCALCAVVVSGVEFSPRLHAVPATSNDRQKLSRVAATVLSIVVDTFASACTSGAISAELDICRTSCARIEESRRQSHRQFVSRVERRDLVAL